MKPSKEYNGRSRIRMFNCDNRDFMNQVDDNYYDLAICDPEYGINAGNYSDKPCRVKQSNGSILKVSKPSYKKSDWDKETADIESLKEVKRISDRQIIWGGNYYGLKGGYLVWDKLNHETDQYDIEMAWMSWTLRTDRVYYLWSGMFQGKKACKNPYDASVQIGNKKLNESRIHPTQKPTKLYRYILKNYAEPNQKIFDGWGGSMSIAMACWDLGFDLDIIELDEDYFNDAVKRFEQHISQTQLF